MRTKQLIVLALTIAVTSGTAPSKDQYVMVRIQCSVPHFEIHFPKHIGDDPKFEFAQFDQPLNQGAGPRRISASGQLIRCDAIHEDSELYLRATYHYKVKRTIIGCMSVAGNPAALDCKVKP